MRAAAERRLAAILHADVVGYSRLMTEDEDATVHPTIPVNMVAARRRSVGMAESGAVHVDIAQGMR